MRWTPMRKEEVVLEVRSGLMTAADACAQHGLSVEELTSWITAYQRRGLAGLKATKRHGAAA